MSRIHCQFLRPYLLSHLRPTLSTAHTSFFLAFQRAIGHSRCCLLDATPDYEKRLEQLQENGKLEDYYPRLPKVDDDARWTTKRFRTHFESLKEKQTIKDVKVTVFGRVSSCRTAGSKLAFFDLVDGRESIQGLCNFRILEENGVSKEEWKSMIRIMRKGDWFSITGYPHRSDRGELSVLATELPQMLAPSLHQIPGDLADVETRARKRHLDLLTRPMLADTVRLRHHIEKFLQDFFEAQDFIRVNTPLITAGAGGAIARPFETRATEFENTLLTLRIAPELFLKRLITANMGRIYEIGPAFRNEGVDLTHNPEFTICEFYMPFATLSDLISMTEILFVRLAAHVSELKRHTLASLPDVQVGFSRPFRQLPFIPTVEARIQASGIPGTHTYKLPNLESPNAVEELILLFKAMNIAIPSSHTLPRLVDELAVHFLEPLCEAPTFVTEHPECLSPLAKTYIDPSTGQKVAARIELFINGREYVNAYEEENSPFEQRRKFVMQRRMRQLGMSHAVDPDGKVDVDENYLEVLEWGLPPTAGFGCGVDRLVMLFAGTNRIADVLTFGTLRNVVAMSKR